MLVRDLMNPHVVSITPVEARPWQPGCSPGMIWGALPVSRNDGRLKGHGDRPGPGPPVSGPGENPERLPVGDIMATRSLRLGQSQCRRAGGRIGHGSGPGAALPVVEDRRVVGMVSLGDLARSRTCDMEAGAALANISRACARV